MEIATEPVRSKRFVRSNRAAPMTLTPRDLKILANVARHRFLSTDHIARLDGGSEQNVSRCLRALFDHGYLDRPIAQLATLPITGPRPMTYGLGKKGARLLHEVGYLVNGHGDWTEKNKRAGTIFIEHTLAVADFMTSLELTCRTRGDITLMREEDVLALAPETTRAAREPLRWSVDKITMGRRETFSVVPDGLFGLSFQDGMATYFLLEIDRGTIPIVRTDRQGTSTWRKSIAYKLGCYWEGWKAKRHETQLGVKQVRVAMVTSSRERVEHMLGVVRDLTEGRGTGFFVFVDRDTLETSDPLAAQWTNARGEMVRLVD